MRAARGQARAGAVALRLARLAATVGAVGLAGTAALAGGCSQDCCSVDSYPIALWRAPLGAPPLGGSTPTSDAAAPDGGALPEPDGGALLAVASLPNAPGGQTFPMVVDTGSPFTILAGPSGATPETNPAGWNLYSYSPGVDPPPLRGTFRNWSVIEVPLAPVGDATLLPQGILGADLLRGYSVELRFGALCAPGSSALCSSMTLWSHLGEDTSLLEDAGYAVIGFTAYGGGEVTADGDPDFLGLRGPLDVPPTRVVLRSCVVPDPFSPAATQQKLVLSKCINGQEALAQASGVDLSLMIDTGVGPLVLSASAWARVVTAAAQNLPTATVLPPVPATPPIGPTPAPLYVATWPTPIDVLLWTTIPRFALVNLEAGVNNDPGPCVELGRARRTEIVSYQTVHDPSADLCGAACDIDPNNTSEAQNSAAYLELAGQIPVAVISDNEPFLQGLRLDILPEGPELDGLVGANALGRSRVELDYLSSPSRAVFSCETDAARASCWAAARCPQLPDHSSQHYCFGLGPHGLPAKCAPPFDAGVLTTTTDAGADGASDGGPTALP